MQVVRRNQPGPWPAKLAILPAAFHPPTQAHMALIEAARRYAGEVLCVLPREFPHKQYETVDLEERLQLLRALPGFSIGVSEGGLFIDIAREVAALAGPTTELFFLCGRDAAERIVGWDYGDDRSAAAMLSEFQLLVAARRGEYRAPEDLRQRIHRLELPGSFDDISSTDVRARLQAGGDWEHLVPAGIVERVRTLYRLER